MKDQLMKLKRLYGLAGPGFARHAAIALGAGLAPLLYNLILAFALKYTFAAATGADRALLASVILCVSLAVTGFFLFNGTMWGFFGASVARMTGRIRSKLFAHLCGLPAPQLEQCHSAAVMTLFTSDASAVENAYGSLLRFSIAASLSGLAAAIVLLMQSPAMGLVILATSLLQLAGNLLFVKPLHSLSARIAKQVEDASTVMGDLIDGSITIRLYGMERRMLDTYGRKSRELAMLNRRLALVEGVIKGGNTVVAVASYVLTLSIGVWMVSQGSLNLPDLLFLTQARGLVMLVVFTIGEFAQMAQPALASAVRLFAFLDKQPEKQQY